MRSVCVSASVRCISSERSAGGSGAEPGEVGVAAVGDGGEQLVPVGALIEDGGEDCERQDPHGGWSW